MEELHPELHNRIEAPMSEQKWIPVSERLPEIDESKPMYLRDVRLIAAWDGGMAEMCYRRNYYAKTEKGRQPRFEWQGRVSPWKVTHWRPLPAPPEKP